ncbi:hypothetical protein AB6A23_12100 [Paenibacillus tarimensis]
MNRDFLQPKMLEGELKLSHKYYDFGVTVSTHEIVFHKPHVNYHIKYSDLISIMPFVIKGKPYSEENRKKDRTELISLKASTDTFKLHVRNAVMHNRSGVTKLGMMQFVFPIHSGLLKIIAEYSGLSQIQ